MRESTGTNLSEDDEDEDMDADLLYLRLIALRSLEVSKPDEEVDDTDENKLAVEMKELLEEAEVAAKEVSECGDTGDIFVAQYDTD